MTAAQQLAKTLADLDRRLKAVERAPRLKNASIEAQSLPVYDADQVLRQTIGAQPDGTYTVVDSNGAPPPVPTPPVLEARPGTLVVTWDGQFAGAATVPADWDHVEVHVSTVSGYTPTDETQVATFNTLKGGSVTLALDPVAQYVVLQAVNTSRIESAPTAEVSGTPTVPVLTGGVKTYYEDNPPVGLDVDDDGSLWFDTNDGNKQYRWDGGTLVWISVQDTAIGDAQSTADAALDAATTDGLAPTASPDPMTLAGLGTFIVRWTPITNPDPVRYEVHVSATLGFTPDMSASSTTRVGTTSGSQFTVRALPGPEPAEGEPDTRTLDYDATYFVRIVAVDDDGAAPASLQAVGVVVRVTGIDLSVDSVTAANIVSGTLTGELFAATVILAGTFKTAESGQRIEVGIAGIKGYKSDGSLMISIPTDSGQEMILDGEFIARRLTVLGGASFQSTDNHLTADAAWTLDRGIVAPSASPQLSVSYDTVRPATSTLTAAQKTGALGTFDLVPSEVTCMEWKPTGSYWVLHQIRPGGTRAWFFDTLGAPYAATGSYFTDYTDWEIWSVFELTTSTPAKNGVYRMARWIPDGAAMTFYLWGPGGLNRYSRQNGAVAPTIGTDGTDVFTAEVVNGSQLRVRYFVPTWDGSNLSSPFSTTESSTGYTASVGLAAVIYHPTGFDIGVGRYLTAERGVSYNAKLLTVSGGAFYPGGSGNNWASANKDAESFESPTSNRRAIAWDGTQFWTYGGDGFLYKHTAERWDPAVSSSTYWGQLTFYDSDATGGTHETAPGAAKSYTAKRRAKNLFTPPAIPDNGGTNDPDRVRLYMARGATLPANANFHLQYEGTTATTFTTLATVTANPPAAGNFPQTTPAKIRNDDDTLAISGDGSVKAVSVVAPTIRVGGSLGTGDDVAIKGPYAYCVLNGNHSTAGGAFSNVTNWQAEVTAFGIVLASGTTLAVPRAGRYRVTIQLSYPTTVTSGSIWADVRKNGAVTPAASFVNSPNTSHSATVGGSKTLTLAANDTLQIRSFKSQAGAVNLANSPELTFWQLEWIGP